MILAVVAGLLEGAGSVVYKLHYLPLGFALFVASILVWALALQDGKLLTSLPVALVVEALVVFSAGIILGERITPHQWVGAVGSLVCVYLIGGDL